MKPVNFDYARPADVGAVLALLDDDSRAVKLMAGSQSLGPMLNMRLVQPDLIVDLTGVAELRRVEETADDLVLGACITHADIEDRRVPDVTRGALPTVAGGIAYRAVRNRGTIGGSLTHADPSADWVSMMAAVGARVRLRGPSGERTLPIEQFIVGALEVDLAANEVLVSVAIPKLSSRARWGYYKLCRKPGEFAHAIGAFVTDPERGLCRVVIGATESRPYIVTDARHLLGDVAASGPAHQVDKATVDAFMTEQGMHDPVDRQIHVTAFRRAIEQAR